MKSIVEVYGKKVDSQGRCIHYHQENDIAGLKCSECKKFYACYKCHNASEEHIFAPSKKEEYCVICGNCGKQLNFREYSSERCISCQASFNPKCHRHWSKYFKE